MLLDGFISDSTTRGYSLSNGISHLIVSDVVSEIVVTPKWVYQGCIGV